MTQEHGYRHSLSALVILMGIANTNIISAQTQSLPQLRIQQADEGKSVKLAASTSKFSLPLTLMESSGKAEAKAKVTLGPITRVDGAAGPQAKIELVADEADIVVPRSGYHQLLLQGELPQAVPYRSWLMLTTEKENVVFELLIDRKPIQLKVLGAVNSRLALTVATGAFRRVITLQLPDGAGETLGLDFQLTGLSREDSQSTHTTELKLSQPIPAASRNLPFVNVELHGERFLPGKYITQLTISGDGLWQILEIELNCPALAQNITLLQPGNSQATNWFWSTTAYAKVDVDETQGRPTQMYLPKLEMLQRLAGEDKSIALSEVNVSLQRQREDRGGDQTNVWANPWLGGSSHDDSAQSLAAVGSRDKMTWIMGIGNLGPGKYKARVAVSGPEIVKQTQEFSLLVRQAWYFAMVPILIGVWVSFALHQYSTVRRQQLVQKINLARLAESLEQDGFQWPDGGVWSALEGRLALLAETFRFQSISATDFDAVLESIRDLASKNLLAIKQFRNLELVVATYPPEMSELSQEFLDAGQQKFSEITSLLSHTVGPDSTALASVAALLQSLTAIVLDARQSRIRIPATLLLRECQQRIGQLADDPFYKPLLKRRLAMIEREVNEILAKVNANELIGLVERLNKVQADFVDFRVEELNDSYERLRTSRAGVVETGQWTTFDKVMIEAKKSLDRVKAMDASSSASLSPMRDAHLTLILAAIEFLAVAIDNGCPEDVPLARWVDWVAEHKLPALLKEARDHCEADDADQALEAYDRINEKFVVVQLLAYTLRVGEFVALIEKNPSWVTSEQWGQELNAAPLKALLGELSKLKDRATATDTSRATHEIAVAALEHYAQLRLKVIESACSSARKLWVAPEVTEVDQMVEEVGRATVRARDKLNAYKAAEVRSSVMLIEADRLGVAAQLAYTALIAFPNRAAVETTNSQVRSTLKQLFFDFPSVAQSHFVATRRLEADAKLSSPRERIEPLIKQIETTDFLVRIVTFLIALVTGFVSLYLANETWGTVADYLVALLWGFGLHEAGHSIVENVKIKGLWPSPAR